MSENVHDVLAIAELRMQGLGDDHAEYARLHQAPNWLDAVERAEGFIAALTAAGYAIVPVEPTEAMRIAGLVALGQRMSEAAAWWRERHPDIALYTTGALETRSEADTNAVFTAILTAAPKHDAGDAP